MTLPAGQYEVRATFTDSNGNYDAAKATTTFTVLKATYDMSGISFVDKTVVYDGASHTIAITGTLPTGVSVSYSAGNTQKNVGEYTITATFTGDSNHNTILSMSAKLTITAATDATVTVTIFFDCDISVKVNGLEISSGDTAKSGDTVTYKYIVKLESWEEGVWNSTGLTGEYGSEKVSGTGDVYISYTITTKTYTIAFKINGVITDVQTNEYGVFITPPDPPNAPDGYVFSGWYTADGKEWNFSTDKVSENTILVAHFDEIEIPIENPSKSFDWMPYCVGAFAFVVGFLVVLAVSKRNNKDKKNGNK